MDGAKAVEVADILPAGLVPRWEQRFPGRLHCELGAFLRAGIVPEIDREALAAGQLTVTLEWPLDGSTTLRLQAVYPDSFPHVRPQVYLLGGLDPPPVRHRAPVDGNLCLLGRDARQWIPSWTLSRLLTEQLEDAVRGTGEEDPQAEPAEYWWNSLNRSGSFCLIDSTWDMAGRRKGTLVIHYTVTGVQAGKSGGGNQGVPGIRAFVEEVRDADNSVLHRWDGPRPPDLREASHSIKVPWVRVDETLLPQPDMGAQVNALLGDHEWLRRGKPHRYSPGLQFDLFAVIHTNEIALGQLGLEWAMFLMFGHLQAFKPPAKKKSKKRLTVRPLPVYRAGRTDIGYRVPAVELLRTKRVLLVGAGAIGAPVAIELARNMCGTLRIIEHDNVEPGNTVRWPLGTAAWGLHKIDALANAVTREYPATTVIPHKHYLGQTGLDAEADGDDDVLDPILEDVDLVIDASASHGVTTLLADRCRQAGVPLISLFATPTLEGGAVVRHGPQGGCPNCLEHAWHKNDIAPPAGRGSEAGLVQPPGCAERTFIGAGYDLQELSLQAVRLAVETLSGEGTVSSIIQTLNFIDEKGCRTPPTWRVDRLEKHPDCLCAG